MKKEKKECHVLKVDGAALIDILKALTRLRAACHQHVKEELGFARLDVQVLEEGQDLPVLRRSSLCFALLSFLKLSEAPWCGSRSRCRRSAPSHRHPSI